MSKHFNGIGFKAFSGCIGPRVLKSRAIYRISFFLLFPGRQNKEKGERVATEKDGYEGMRILNRSNKWNKIFPVFNSGNLSI